LIIGIGRRRGELDPSDSAIVDQFMRGRPELKLGTYDPSFAAAWNAVKTRQAKPSPRADGGSEGQPLASSNRSRWRSPSV